MAKIVSSSDSAPNQLEQLAKDSLRPRNGGAHPWTVQDGARSDLVLFNHSSRAEPFNILITTDDGAQWSKQLTLAPFETRTVSINDLIRNNTPDSHGRTVPVTAWSGTVVWYTGGPGTGSGHVLIRNDANSTGENFSCDEAYVLCSAWADAFPTAISIGDTGTAIAEEELCVEWGVEGICGGDYMYTTDQSTSASWTSGNDSVVSIIDYSWQPTYQGNAEGSTYLIGIVMDQWKCSATVYTPTISVVAPDDTPIVTGIAPSNWPADSTAHQVTFTGQHFGSNSPTLSFSDPSIGYSLLSSSDTQIVAYVTVPEGTPTEDVSVTVTSGGYTGNPFKSGGGSVSPSSTPALATVDTPPQNCPAAVTVDVTLPRSLPSLTDPSALTGIGILTRMLVSPVPINYNGVKIYEMVTPKSNGCPANIRSATDIPAVYSLFTVGSPAYWEGVQFGSYQNSFYDQHVIYIDYDVLGATSGASCSATATQVYTCDGNNIGTFTITNTYTHGTISGQPVTNITTTKQ